MSLFPNLPLIPFLTRQPLTRQPCAARDPTGELEQAVSAGATPGEPGARQMNEVSPLLATMSTAKPSPAAPAAVAVAAPVKPSLRLCGRRLRLASDDFAVVGAGPLLLQSMQLGCALLLLISIYATGECAAGTVGRAFVLAWTAVAGLGLLCDVTLIGVSLRGSISNDAPRRAVAGLLPLSLLLDVLQFGTIAYGALVYFDDRVNCFQEADDYLFACVIVGFVIVLVRFCRFIYIFRVNCLCCCPPLPPSPHERAKEFEAAAGEVRWTHLLRLLCCCAKTPEKSVWQDLASLFHVVFGHEQYTLGDLATALRLVNVYHQQLRRGRRALQPEQYAVAPWGARVPLVPLHTPADQQVLEDLLQIMPFALGAFGWPLWCFMTNPVVGGCKLLCSAQKDCCCTPAVHGDICCRSHTGAFLLQSGLQPQDILYASLHNAVCCPHFYVVVSHELRALVLSVRGTLSASDLVTDGLARVIDVELPALPGQKLRAHEGIWTAADNIRKQLLDDGILAQVLANRPELRGYRLLTTGQSLGSAVASVLSLQMQNCSQLPLGLGAVHCYAFSPAPVIDRPALAFAEAHITAITVGSDMVARLSLVNLHRAKLLVRAALASSRDSKCRVLCGGWLGLRPQDPWWERVDLANVEAPTAPTVDELCLPGRIIHLVKSQDTIAKCGCFGRKRSLQAFWSHADNFDNMWVNPRMVLDHMPDYVFERLKEVVADMRKEQGAAATAINLAAPPTSPAASPTPKPVLHLAAHDEYSEV